MTWVSALPKSLAIARSFLLIGIPHRDHTTSFTSRGPNECDNTATQLSEGEVARLAVIPAVVRDREVRTGEDESGRKRRPRMRGLAPPTSGRVRLIEDDLHLLYIRKYRSEGGPSRL